MDRRAFMLTALALGGCATARPPPAAPAAAPALQPLPPPRMTPGAPALSELEPLYKADAGRDVLTISVASNGCTTRSDFAFFVERRGEAVSLAFGRRRVDTCKSFAMGRIDLTFTWAELGVTPRTPVFLLNPLVGWTGPGR